MFRAKEVLKKIFKKIKIKVSLYILANKSILNCIVILRVVHGHCKILIILSNVQVCYALGAFIIGKIYEFIANKIIFFVEKNYLILINFLHIITSFANIVIIEIYMLLSYIRSVAHTLVVNGHIGIIVTVDGDDVIVFGFYLNK